MPEPDLNPGSKPGSDPDHDLSDHVRWRFFRDVLVFPLKLMLGNLQNLLLVPLCLGAAAIDLIFKGDRHGRLFYRVLEWGRATDQAIDVYSAIGGYRASRTTEADVTVDSLLAHVEGAIVREYEKGGTAASVKAAVDRILDQVQARSEKAAGKFRE